MNTQGIMELVKKLSRCGPTIVFITMYLEGLSLTGIPANILMPAIGLYIKQMTQPLAFMLLLAIGANVIGNITFYWIAFLIGDRIYDYLYRKMPRTRKALDKAKKSTEKYGDKVCLIGRLIPGVRAFISLTAGLLRMDFRAFLAYSIVGITIWDVVCILSGYAIAHIA